MSAPLYEHLLAYSKQNRISFAMPGHKNGRGLKKDLLSLDVTELSATENLIHPGEYVLKAHAAPDTNPPYRGPSQCPSIVPPSSPNWRCR